GVADASVVLDVAGPLVGGHDAGSNRTSTGYHRRGQPCRRSGQVGAGPVAEEGEVTTGEAAGAEGVRARPRTRRQQRGRDDGPGAQVGGSETAAAEGRQDRYAD